MRLHARRKRTRRVAGVVPTEWDIDACKIRTSTWIQPGVTEGKPKPSGYRMKSACAFAVVLMALPMTSSLDTLTLKICLHAERLYAG
jgi:hypothetical protein